MDTTNAVILSQNLIKAQEFYSSQFSNFTMVVSVLAIFLVAFTAIAITVNIRSINNSKKDFEKLKEEYRELNKEFSKIRKDIEDDKNNLIKLREEIFREMARSYIKSSWDHLYKKDTIRHFSNLSDAFELFNNYKITLYDKDLEMFEVLIEIFEHYKEDYLSDACVFLDSFVRFMMCYKDKLEALKKAKKTWDKLCSKLGGKDKVLKAIENYIKEK